MRIAVLGATGAVGRTMLRVLEERRVPFDELVLLASERSSGQRIACGGREWTVQAPAPGVFRECGVALFSAGAARSREWAPRAAEEGAVVVDNSSAWRMDARVPLVVPEINGARVTDRPLGIIGNPNCAAIQLVLVLAALRRAAALRRVLVSTYQAVSGAGQKGLAALRQERSGERAAESPFAAPIDRNVIPLIGARGTDGWTEEEDKIRNETRKILELPELPVAATCVRVPVEVGHAIAASIELERALPLEEARAALRAHAGIELVEGERVPLPRDVAGTDAVRVGRVRSDRDLPHVLHLWIVADNLRKGAASNAVQIAERVLRG